MYREDFFPWWMQKAFVRRLTGLIVFLLGAVIGWIGASSWVGSPVVLFPPPSESEIERFNQHCLASLERESTQTNRCITGWSQTKDLLVTCVSALERERGKYQ